MFGDISNWFLQGLAGIGLDPESPGFAHVLVRPQVVGGLTWAKGSHVGPRGEISSAWRVAEGRFHLDVRIPANTTATIWIPTKEATKVMEGGGATGKAEGVVFLRQEPEAVVYAVGAGMYAFAAPMPALAMPTIGVGV